MGGRLLGGERPYAEVLDAALRKLGGVLGIHSIPPPMTSIALSVDELQGATFAYLLGPGSLSWLGLPFLLAPLVWSLARRHRGRIRAVLEPGPSLLAWLSAGLLAGSLLFSRNKIVLAPLAAIVIGGLFAALDPVAPTGAAPRSRSKGRAHALGAGAAARSVARALLVACILATAWDALKLALTRESGMEPVLTDWPATWKVRAGVPLNRKDADRVLVRMMVLDESPPPFERVFKSGQWRVYRRVE